MIISAINRIHSLIISCELLHSKATAMAVDMKARLMIKVDQMVEELSLFFLSITTRGTFLKASSMGEAERFNLTVSYTMASGKVVLFMDSVYGSFQIILNIKDIYTWTSAMLLESLHIQMEDVMRANLILINSMGMEFGHC